MERLKRRAPRAHARAIIPVLTIIGIAVAACSSGSSSASDGAKGSSLSMTNVTVAALAENDSALAYIAQQAGFFKKQGLNVNLLDEGAPTSAAMTAALVGGSYQFADEPLSAGLLAVQAGTPIKAVFATDIGNEQDLSIASATAAKLHVPNPGPGATPGQSLAQLAALKGAHITVAATTTASGTYIDLVAACAAHGLTCKLNDPSADLNISTVGSNPAEIAGFKAGKFPAFAAGIPSALQPGTVSINLANIPPASQAAFWDFATSQSMINSHPDTVQAFVTAMTQAWQYARDNPAKARTYHDQMENIAGVTSPALLETLYNSYSHAWVTPLLLQAAYANAVKVSNLAAATPSKKITVAYNQWNDPTFVNKAVTQLGITPPQNP
jgi:NitT/TauT family transport system substrate-binding protein